MPEPIPVTMAELPQLLRELSLAGAGAVGFEEVDGVRYLVTPSHPGTRWHIVDPDSEPAAGDPGDFDVPGAARATLVVEIHVPLVPAPGLPEDDYQFPWIMDVQDRTAALTLESDGAEDYDDGEELGEHYAFFLTGEDRGSVLAAAKRIATGPGVPAGAFLVVNDGHGDLGEGERVDLTAIA